MTTKPMTAASTGVNHQQLEAAVLRAWRASVTGLFFCRVIEKSWIFSVGRLAGWLALEDRIVGWPDAGQPSR